MCVICYKPRGIKINKIDMMECMTANPHGMGFMYAANGAVHIMKGYYDVFTMLDDLVRCVDDIDNTDIVFHFRIATSGKIDDYNCHPFPISADRKSLGKIKSTAPMGFAHNGLIVDHMWNAKELKINSDSFLFVRDILSQMLRGKKSLPDWVEKALDLIAVSNYSKFIVMDGNNTITMFGDKWKVINGCFYSNSHWLGSTYKNKNKYYDYEVDYGRDLGYTTCEWCDASLMSQHEIYIGLCDDCIDLLEDDELFEDQTMQDIKENSYACDYCGTNHRVGRYDNYLLCDNCVDSLGMEYLNRKEVI